MNAHTFAGPALLGFPALIAAHAAPSPLSIALASLAVAGVLLVAALILCAVVVLVFALLEPEDFGPRKEPLHINPLTSARMRNLE